MYCASLSSPGCCGRVLVWLTMTMIWGAQLAAAAAPESDPPTQLCTASLNVSGSLGYQCSSQNGLDDLIQQGSVGGNNPGLNITVPADLSNPLTTHQIAQIAWEYIYSYPLPIMAKTLASGTLNGTASNKFYARNDQLSSASDNARYQASGVVGPNDDTLYGSAFLDLSQGPQQLTVPTFDAGRYWEVPFIDVYTNVNSSIGSHYNSSAGSYLVIGPDAAAGTDYGNFTSPRIIHAPTDIIQITARVQVLNQSDVPTAAKLLNEIVIAPYNTSVNATGLTSKTTAISNAINGVSTQQLSQSPADWFMFAATYVAINPPGNGTGPYETALVELSRAARNASGPALEAFRLGQQVATQCIMASQVDLITTTGWSFRTGPTWGSDYLQRARHQVARNGLEQQMNSEALDITGNIDSQNQTLDASTGNNYTLALTVPLPAGAFWSLTMYNATNFLFISNPINRYSIGEQTDGLVYSGADNSTLEVFISAEQPPDGTPQLANWLPAPNNVPFQLRIRLYEPADYVLTGHWQPPAVQRA